MSFIKNSKRQVRTVSWLLLFLYFTISPAGAQKYFFDNYGIEQGLSEQKVYTLLQDSRDYIWLGTANGVSRFDGKNFRNFTTSDSLASGGVRSMFEDPLGNIWFGHLNGGISRYNGRFFEKIGFDSLKLTGDVTAITWMDDELWFCTRSDGALVAEFPIKDPASIMVRQYTGKKGLSDQVYGVEIIQDTSLICITDVGTRRYNRQEDKFEIFRMPHMTTYFNTTCLLEDSHGDIWFGTYNGGLYWYVMSESRMVETDLIKAGLSSNHITCMAEDSEGKMWVGTWGGGIALFENGTLRKLDATIGLQASQIQDIMEDVEGNILIVDQDYGLTIYKGDAFMTINDKEMFPNLNVNAVYQDNEGDMWFGTKSGILRYAPDQKPVIYDEESNYFPDDITMFREDMDGNLWIGTREGGVILYNMKTSRFESQAYINSRFPPNHLAVTAMEIDHKNNLWIGTVEGLIAGTVNEENFIRRIAIDSVTINRTITALYNDPNGNMWIGIEPSGDKPTLFFYEPGKEKFSPVYVFSGITPVSMAMDGKGVLWIGTNDGVRALKNDSIVYSIRHSDGLLSGFVNMLVTGDDGSIFIGSNDGLNRYFPERGRMFSYTEKNGFPGVEARINAVYKNGNGDIWFGTANGATQMNIRKAIQKDLEPLTHIHGILVDNKPREMIPGMKLSYSERSIILDYYSICLTNPDVVRYRVMLEPADNDWQPVTEVPRATYPGLSFGKYTFKVMARNSQGVWNSEPVAFSFTIKPPFYLAWWFLLTAAVIAILGVVAYIKMRERKLITEKIMLEEKVKERTAEVVQKSMEIEEKNKDITASIRYAERIQRAMLPRDDTFHDTFVLFKPKDIVSGDFYWMYGNGEYQYIAVCDCTGHGVPGAFMSIIGHNSLNKVVREYGITRPSAILDQLNLEVFKALMQRHEEPINDGMDMALIAFDKKNFTLHFAGAYNPLYIVRKGEVSIFKGDRFPIGMKTGSKKNFTNHIIEIQPGDMLYMCSDGYADQFGSAEMKKYKSGNVRKLLSEIWSLPCEDQKRKLEEEITAWKGDLPQVDDILFIGTRIPEN